MQPTPEETLRTAPDALRLGWTSGLHVLLAEDFNNENPIAAAFTARLDLSDPGISVALADLERAGSLPICKEQVSARKRIVLAETLEAIASLDGEAQVVSLGAGFDPLALEVLTTDGTAAVRFFEVDATDLSGKMSLYSELVPDACDRITMLQSDVTSDELAVMLEGLGLDRSRPIVIVAEGLVHYMNDTSVTKMLMPFCSPGDDKRNRVVLEYCAPLHEVDSEVARLVAAGYRMIAERSGGGSLTQYSIGEMKQIFDALDADWVRFDRIFEPGRFLQRPNQAWLRIVKARF